MIHDYSFKCTQYLPPAAMMEFRTEHFTITLYAQNAMCHTGSMKLLVPMKSPETIWSRGVSVFDAFPVHYYPHVFNRLHYIFKLIRNIGHKQNILIIFLLKAAV